MQSVSDSRSPSSPWKSPPLPDIKSVLDSFTPPPSKFPPIPVDHSIAIDPLQLVTDVYPISEAVRTNEIGKGKPVLDSPTPPPSKYPPLPVDHSIAIDPLQLPTDVHPISEAVRANEIGKGLIYLAVPIVVTIMVITYEKKMKKGADWMVVGLMVALAFIWNGILCRANFNRVANLAELIGITLFLISVFGFVAISLSRLWAYIILGITCFVSLLPLFVSLKHSADFVNGSDGDVGGGGAVFEGGASAGASREFGGGDGGGLAAVQMVNLEA